MKFRIRDYKTKSRKVYRDDHSQKIFERRVRCLLLIPLVISFLWCLITDAHKKYEAKSETVQETPAVEDSEPPSIEPVETPAEEVKEKVEEKKEKKVEAPVEESKKEEEKAS